MTVPSSRSIATLLLFFSCIWSVAAREVKNKDLRFTVELPANLAEIDDSVHADGSVFFDSTAGIILMLSGRKSNFKTVKDYIDCTQEELEARLRENFGDTSLQLISCNKAIYYPDKTTIILFSVDKLPFGYNTYTIFFIHHRHRDIQFSFTYRKDNVSTDIPKYIDAVMKTLVLN